MIDLWVFLVVPLMVITCDAIRKNKKTLKKVYIYFSWNFENVLSIQASSGLIVICHWSLLWCIFLPLFWLSLDEHMINNVLLIFWSYITSRLSSLERGCMENICLLKNSPASGHIFYSFDTLFNDMLFSLVAFLLYVHVFHAKGCKWWMCESLSVSQHKAVQQ